MERVTASAEAVSIVSRRHPGTQLFQRAVQDLGRRGILDELDQRFDGVGILDRCGIGMVSLSVRCAVIAGRLVSLF